MNGKGDTPRPLSVPRKEFNNNWDLAFGQKQRNVPDPLPLRKLDVPLIEGEIKPIGPTPNYGVSVLERFRKQYHQMATMKKLTNSELVDELEPFETFGEDNRGLRDSDNTPEASGSTIQPPS